MTVEEFEQLAEFGWTNFILTLAPGRYVLRWKAPDVHGFLLQKITYEATPTVWTIAYQVRTKTGFAARFLAIDLTEDKIIHGTEFKKPLPIEDTYEHGLAIILENKSVTSQTIVLTLYYRRGDLISMRKAYAKLEEKLAWWST